MLCGIRRLSAQPCLFLWMGFAFWERDVRFVWDGWVVPLMGLHSSVTSSRWCLGEWHPPGVVSKV